MKLFRYSILAAIFLLSLVFPLTVFADDEVPPTATEEPVVADQTPPEADPISETLEQLPDDTQLIVLNETGEVEPLVTQAAAEIILIGDPIWCPQGVAPQAGVGGCTDPGVGNSNYDPTSFGSLLNYLTSNQPGQAGVIWIEKNYDSSINDVGVVGFNIDGASLNVMKDYALTIQGGWSGISGDTGVDHADRSTFTGAFLNIDNWNADVTINDILITGVASLDNGLTVDTTQDISVNNVSSGNNAGPGALLDNTAGSGTVTVTNSKFDNSQGGAGLFVNSSGKIELENVNASDNYSIGAYVNNNYNASVEGVRFTGTNVFSGNGAYGLVAISNGDIYLSSVFAGANGSNAPGYSGALLDTLGNIMVCGGGFGGNSGYGLEASLSGLLTLSNVALGGGLRTYGGTGVVNDSSLCPVPSNGDEIGLPLQIIPVSSDGSAEFDCDLFSGTVLVLPSGDKVTYKCPIAGSGTLAQLDTVNLPASLPAGMDYVAGIDTVQSPAGSDKPLNGAVVISFIIPENLQGPDLAILYWDGSKWIDLDKANFDDGRAVINGGYFTGDGYFEAITNFSGSFVLVKK